MWFDVFDLTDATYRWYLRWVFEIFRWNIYFSRLLFPCRTRKQIADQQTENDAQNNSDTQIELQADGKINDMQLHIQILR